MIRQALAPRPAAAPTPAPRRTIPYDYSFRFTLTGTKDTVHTVPVTVSIEAAFVAVAIGYGVVPTVTPIKFGAVPPLVGGVPSGLFFDVEGPAVAPPPALRDLTLGAVIDGLTLALPETASRQRRETLIDEAFRAGIRLNPELAGVALAAGNGRTEPGTVRLSPSVLAQLFQVVTPLSDQLQLTQQVQFKYALFDEATGREFQSEPILNIAGLGIANGDRPFRAFAQPITLAPRSTIRMEVTELSGKGELHVTLQGYKVLGGAGTPTGRRRR